MTIKSTRVPLYRLIESELMRRIGEGVYPAGSAFPTENSLCAEFDVSRITVRRALEVLESRRLLDRVAGRGTVVVQVDDMVKSVSLTGYIDDVIPLNRHLVVDDGMRIPPDAVVQLLQTGAFEAVRCVRTVNHAAELPLSFSHFYFPKLTAGVIDVADFKGAVPPIRVVEQRSGHAVEFAEQVVDAVNADEEVGARLGVPPGTAVLRATRAYFTAQKECLEVAYVHYHPDRYRYRATLLPKVVPVR